VGAAVTFSGFKGRVAVVTGGSRGSGAAACRLLAASGARVAAVAADETALQDVVDELRWLGGDAIGVVADTADPAGAAVAVASVLSELGPADVVFAFPPVCRSLVEAFGAALVVTTDESIPATRVIQGASALDGPLDQTVAFAAVFLASDAFTSTQGATLAISG
jgi:hypothetical protein